MFDREKEMRKHEQFDICKSCEHSAVDNIDKNVYCAKNDYCLEFDYGAMRLCNGHGYIICNTEMEEN